MNPRNVRWVEVIGSSVADFVGGRPAVALRAAVKIWGQLGGQANEKVAQEIERSSNANEQPSAERVAGSLSMSEVDTVAVDFGLALTRSWQQSGEPDLLLFVDDIAIRIWEDSAAIRDRLARIVYDPDEIRMLCRDAGLNMARITLQGPAERQWFTVFEYLRYQPPSVILFLLYLASRRAPDDRSLRVWEPGD